MDFLSLFDEKNGGDCYCMAWHRKRWDEFDSNDHGNRVDRHKIMNDGISDGFLIYLNNVVIGWVQAGNIAYLPNVKNTFGNLFNEGDILISCIKIKEEYRGKGLATDFIKLVTDELKKSHTRILAIPTRYKKFDQEEVWTGTMGIYERSGYVPIYDDGKTIIMQSS